MCSKIGAALFSVLKNLKKPILAQKNIHGVTNDASEEPIRLSFGDYLVAILRDVWQI